MHIRQWSMPAPAAPSGYCDLCDTAMLASLHEALPARLTHLLNKLSQDVLEKGFLYVREALGSSANSFFAAAVTGRHVFSESSSSQSQAHHPVVASFVSRIT